VRKLLLVEDHAESRKALATILEQRGYRVEQASNGRAALAIARRETLHALIIDLHLPDLEGLSVLQGVLEHHPRLPSIVVTAFGSIDNAVEAMKRGASDFLTKPIQAESMIAVLERSIEKARDVVPVPPSEASAAMEKLGIIGRSSAMLNLFNQLRRIAPHQSTILIQGESGTGKELVARALHRLGPRPEGPFVTINCATLSESLLESELFGYEKGAFTGADQRKAGVMEQADQGTLFLDEVSEMGLACQAKLLRALEQHEFRRVGGVEKTKVDIILIAACNVDLEKHVEAGKFRSDLYYRLKVVSLLVPPLRERKDAIPILAQRFLEDAAKHAGMPSKRLDPETLQLLVRYPWPGNVRELRNFMESLTLLVSKPQIAPTDLPPKMWTQARGEVRVSPGMRLDDIEREVIRLNLETYPTVKDAARALGVPLRTFHDKLRRYGLRKPRPT
jgi:two-component system, NtrC family, response regulator AtoC